MSSPNREKEVRTMRIKVNGFDEYMNARLIYRGNKVWIYAEPVDDDEYGIVWNVSEVWAGGRRQDYFTRTALDALKLIKLLIERD